MQQVLQHERVEMRKIQTQNRMGTSLAVQNMRTQIHNTTRKKGEGETSMSEPRFCFECGRVLTDKGILCSECSRRIFGNRREKAKP